MNLNKHIPNLITITRIIMSFLFVYAIVKQFIYGREWSIYLIILFLGICSSDWLDGKIARKTNAVSAIGAKLDVFADLLYIVISYVTLINVKILPIWFFIFVCFKFFEFVLTSRFMNNYKSTNNPFVFDKIGRIVSATFLIIPGIVCIYRCFKPYNIEVVFNCFIFVILIAGMYSSYLRIKKCIVIRKVNNIDIMN